MSVKLFDRIRDENVHGIREDELDEDQAARVRDIISAGHATDGVYAPEGKRWQYEVWCSPLSLLLLTDGFIQSATDSHAC